MKISEIPVKRTLTTSEISSGYMLGLKNVYPDDTIPVHELQRFPITAFLSDNDMETTRLLIKRLRTISSEIEDKKKELKKEVNKVQTINDTILADAKLQKKENTISYTDVTSQLSQKFATPEEFQNVVDAVYSELFKAIEDMMVQVFTTSMYARQYTPIIDDYEYEDPKEST